MTVPRSRVEIELESMQEAWIAVYRLEPDERARVLRWLTDRIEYEDDRNRPTAREDTP